ncbi:active regulator of SIRT1-like [Belonocnema kinseyi]|uniref:active regulator of SIRT1-like n=1 Tax=Belonocnema kinseyi TaxID=2817044 RepID=UPI00143D0FED|nr:active regulator of SIRT1-like [Belonocnema kinseyi]
MSNSLVHKSLELLEYEQEIKQGKSKKRSKNKGILDLIPTNHRLTSKRKKSKTETPVNRSSRLNIYEAKKRLEAKTDPTEGNIKKLLLLGNSRLDSETADKLIERAVKKRYIHKEEKREEQTTVFTEEDFKKFEQEYLAE